MTAYHHGAACAKPEANKSARDERAQGLRKSIDAQIDTLAKAVDAARASEAFQAYLDTQARFHDYSWHNTWLILSQRPSATRVAGFETWKKLGRFVRKGEHGIMIFAPCKWKRERDKGDGSTETEQGIFFKSVYVFDVAQTDGRDLPTVDVPDIAVAADSLLSDLGAVCAKRGIALAFRRIEGGAYGFATDKGKSIVVDDSHATGQRAKTLAHELAHCALHWEDRGPLTRTIAELEAESVAYVVCKHFGLDTDVRSSAYIALWGGDSKSLKASLERIAKTARELIDDVEAVRSGEAPPVEHVQAVAA